MPLSNTEHPSALAVSPCSRLITADKIEECIYSKVGGLTAQRHMPCTAPQTEAYKAAGYLTGVRSRVALHRPASKVYNSLARDMHLLFTPITVSALCLSLICGIALLHFLHICW